MDKVSKSAREAYETLLREANDKSSSEAIGNLYPWHGRAAVAELSRHAYIRTMAEDYSGGIVVRILTGSGTDHVYSDSAMEYLRPFLENGGRVQVLVWNSHSPTCNLVQLKDLYPSRVQIRVAGQPSTAPSPPHFFLVGTIAYRFETPHKPFEPNEVHDFGPEVPARICFNDAQGGQRLAEFFDRIWKALDKKAKRHSTES